MDNIEKERYLGVLWVGLDGGLEEQHGAGNVALAQSPQTLLKGRRLVQQRVRFVKLVVLSHGGDFNP